MTTITLTGTYGYSSYKVSSGIGAGSLIDASDATWTVSNSGTKNEYPFLVYNAGLGTTVRGGTIVGTIDQTADWRKTYDLGNSAALRFENSPGVIIDDWRIDKAWDAIRIAGGSNNFLIDDAYVSNVRDDAIENDYLMGGTIRDSLFDGVFTGISLGDSDNYDGSGNTVTFDGVLMRMQTYSYEGEQTHYSPLKTNKSAPDTVPDLRFINTVIAIEDPNHEGQERLKLGWDNVVESRGNVFLNLSDKPLPANYPKPPAGWTILQGQAARDYWNKAKADWLASHAEGAEQPAPQPQPEPQPEPDPQPEPAPQPEPQPQPGPQPQPQPDPKVTEVKGTSGKDVLYGTAGEDLFTGGRGSDAFVFNKALGSVDKIVDFNVKEDRIYLDNAIFTKLGSGSLSKPKGLSSSYFDDDGFADDRNDYITYDRATGTVYYDADGNGKGAQVAVLKVTPGLKITDDHFFVI